MQSLEDFLEANLSEGSFYEEWLSNAAASKNEVRDTYQHLLQVGCSPRNIAERLSALTQPKDKLEQRRRRYHEMNFGDRFLVENLAVWVRDPETVQAVYDILRENRFSQGSIETRPDILTRKPSTVRERIRFLRNELKLLPRRFRNHIHLIARDPESLRENHEALLDLGISPKAIRAQPGLLGRNPCTIQQRYEALAQRGVSERALRRKPQLLEHNPETLEGKLQFLESQGFTVEDASKHPRILMLAEKTLRQRYNHHVSQTSQEFLHKSPALLGIPKETFSANTDLLHSYGVPLETHSWLYKTTPETKRKKAAEILGIAKRTVGSPNMAYDVMKQYIKENPRILVRGTKAIRKSASDIREAMLRY